MPGEEVESALKEAEICKDKGIGTVFTKLEKTLKLWRMPE